MFIFSYYNFIYYRETSFLLKLRLGECCHAGYMATLHTALQSTRSTPFPPLGPVHKQYPHEQLLSSLEIDRV